MTKLKCKNKSHLRWFLEWIKAKSTEKLSRTEFRHLMLKFNLASKGKLWLKESKKKNQA